MENFSTTDLNEKNLSEQEKAVIKDWKSCMRRNFVQAGFLAVFGGAFWKFYLGAIKNPPVPPVFGPRDCIIAVGNFCLASVLGTPLCFIFMKNKYNKSLQTIFDERKEQEYLADNQDKLNQNLSTTTFMDSDSNFDLNTNWDTSEPTFSHLHFDFDSPYSETFVDTDSEEKPPKKETPQTTYDDLRRQHRETFAKSYVEKVINGTADLPKQDGISIKITVKSKKRESNNKPDTGLENLEQNFDPEKIT